MLEWSRVGYWLTMRFIPGATNRWRACHHLDKLNSLGMHFLKVQRNKREQLPIPLSRISAEYRELGEEELRTTSLDVVAVTGDYSGGIAKRTGCRCPIEIGINRSLKPAADVVARYGV